MKTLQTLVLLCGAMAALAILPVSATPALRDGQHDFDYQFGAWHVHVRRLLHPHSGSTAWVNYDGTHVVTKVWNGRANLGVLEIDGPAGHIEGQSLRLYDPRAHQWIVSFAPSSTGTMGQPMAGAFDRGRGEFFNTETQDGRTVLVRSITSDITATSYRDEYAYSDDGGETWEPNWIATYTRASSSITPKVPSDPGASDSQSHAFDFNFGTWRTHIHFLRLLPNGSTDWVAMSGKVAVRKIWGGRALMEEIAADGPAAHLEGLTMFLYNPQTHQWTQTFAGSDGSWEASMYGTFSNGRGVLVSQDVYNGKMALIRGVWSNITPNAHRFEEFYSYDAGASWHPAFIGDLTRLK